jgi:hypothetical protein
MPTKCEEHKDKKNDFFHKKRPPFNKLVFTRVSSQKKDRLLSCFDMPSAFLYNTTYRVLLAINLELDYSLEPSEKIRVPMK